MTALWQEKTTTIPYTVPVSVLAEKKMIVPYADNEGQDQTAHLQAKRCSLR